MERLALETRNITDENIKKILELFPNVATETLDENGKLKTAIDFEKLKQELSEVVIDGEESYDFTWVGKNEAMLEANRPIRKTLRPDRESSVDWENTQNVYIEGDNLDALKLLQESYLGKIKMIYIDPPYNTGKDFVYRDNFTQDKESYNEELGLKDEDENRLFQNTESNGRFHSDWCSMIYSRLKLARNLLSDDGVIFISIDDNEVDNLKKICDEIFGEDNFVNIISLKMKNIAGASGGGEDKRLKKNIEYILLYAKDYNMVEPFNKIYNQTEISELLKKYRDEDVSWKYTSILKNRGEKVFLTSTIDGDGNKINIYKRINPEFCSVVQIMKDESISESKVYSKYFNDIYTTAMPQSSIRTRVMNAVEESQDNTSFYSIEYIPKTGKNKGKLYEQFYKGEKFRLLSWFSDVAEIKDGIVYKNDMLGTLWDKINLNNLTKEGNIKYDNGKKPLELITKLIKMISGNNDIICDFFSGSATTAHSIMQLNLEDDQCRKFIMIQLPEQVLPISKENKEYLEYLKSENIKAYITEIGKERIRRAGKKIKEENPDKKIDVGFRVFKVDTTNMKDVYYTPSELKQGQLNYLETNIKDDRTDEDLLYGCLLDWGVELSLPHRVEIIDGKKVHIVDNDALIACFEENIPESVIRKIADMKPLRVVFRDSSFISDDNKINIEEIFKLITPDTRVKVI